MKLKPGLFNLLVIALITAALSGCQLFQAAKFTYANATSTHKWLSNSNTTQIPFTLVSDLIIVPVSINGSEPLNFVFDTGAAATVILESNDTHSLELKSDTKLDISGGGESFQSIANVVPNINVTLGDIELIEQTIIHLPVSSVPFFKDRDSVFFDGIIGYDFLKRFAIKVDYDKAIITLSEQTDYAKAEIEHDKSWHPLPISIEGGMSYVSVDAQLSTKQVTPLKLLIDTGFSGTFEIVQAQHENYLAPYYPSRIQGLNGYSTVHVSNSKSLSLGRYSKNNVPVLFNMSSNKDVENSELLGNQFLKHFNIIFDYRNEQLFIKPNQNFDRPINLDKSGLRLMPHKLGAIVNDVSAKTGADNLGLKTGDIITSYNGKKITPEGFSTLTSTLASNLQRIKLCWLSNSTEICDDLVLASRLKQ
ncbi:aspartyl protease family protein [Thalassotalea fonticola]|uniref:Aspartyl protease family protein n=1 Tax=Thalassotalea fonticola TaxID=3065649 RepID=A0ABZ0GKI3_9GAMM|nr:aspartyl protease family protein [Colwelliaceae bacterium S1-1]